MKTLKSAAAGFAARKKYRMLRTYVLAYPPDVNMTIDATKEDAVTQTDVCIPILRNLSL